MKTRKTLPCLKLIFRYATTVVTSFMLAAPAFGAAVIPFYEPFPSTYGDNENFGNAATSGVIWDIGNSISSSCGRVATAAAQNYPGLVTDASSRGLRSNTGGSGAKNRGATLNITNQTLYTSFLLKVLTTNINTRPFFGFSTGTNVTLNGAIIHLDSNLRLSLAKNSTTPETNLTAPLTLSNTYLLVMRYKFNAGATNNDEMALWINPNNSLGVSDANIPAPVFTITNNPDLTNLGSIVYFQNTSTPGLFYIDEVRVSTNWAEVTPPACTPGTLFNVTGGGTSCGGSPVPVGLSGSEIGTDYGLRVNSGDASILNGTGGALAFGGQTNTGTYTVYASNTTSGCTFWMNGNAQVAFSSPPSIATQPIPMNAVSGSSGTFSVTGVGDNLNYQWRRDGTNLINSGNISGATTPNLTIYPIGAGDVASSGNGYDVVVSGFCAPAATSTRVALSLKALSNLVWVGDGISNIWDVALSTNWTSSGTPSVFSFGDRVTFDDSSANGTVSLAGAYLSPSGILVSNSAVNYSFGAGSVNGPTALIKTGTGTLTLSNANTFTGGTIISNGVISLGGNEANATLVGGISAFGPVTNSVTFYGSASDSATLELFGFNGGTGPTYNTFQNPVVIPANQVGTVRVPPRGPTAFALTGSGTLNLVVNFIRDELNGNWSAFTGHINVLCKTTGDQFRVNNTNGYANAAIYLNDNVNFDNVSANNTFVNIGELGGTSLSFLGGGDSGRTTDWRIGARNSSTNFDGLIRDLAPAITSITKVGSGTWTLTSANTHTGNTTVSNGVLALSGSGSISASTNITVISGAVLDVSGRNDGTLALGSGQTLRGGGTIRGSVDCSGGGNILPGLSLGTLTITNVATLGGEMTMELNRLSVPNSDRIVANQIICGGTVVVTNSGGKLSAGDTFQLFSGAISGSFGPVFLPSTDASGATYTWNNQLENNGTIIVLTATGGVDTSRTNIKVSVTGSTLTLSWPSNHTGWLLQAQTNSTSVGLKNIWADVIGSTTTNQVVVPISSANGSVFYRLVLP